MNKYKVILKSLKDSSEVVSLTDWTTEESANQLHKRWRKLLGGRNWTENRRPGLDTLDHLALTVVRGSQP